MNSENWRIRKVEDRYKNSLFFFIEADLPNAIQNGHYPRVEVMQEDYGEHNGYTEEMRMADAQLIVAAPKMKKAITEVLEALSSPGCTNMEWIKSHLAESIKTQDA